MTRSCRLESVQVSRATRFATALVLSATAVYATVGMAQQSGIAEPLGPRGTEGAPDLSVPLAEPDQSVDAFEVAPRRDRLPDETRVRVKRFVVTRLEPRGEAPAGCAEVIYRDFCGVQVKDWRLTAELDKLLSETYQRELSVFDLEDVAVRVTDYYRAQDRILDTAFVPPQTVADGAVNIYVLSGRLGKVDVEGNKRYKAEVLAWPFASELGEPVSRGSMTHSLLNVWDYPGLLFAQRKANITFVPGEKTGETDIRLQVQEDPLPFNLVLSGDNAGSQYSGEYRARADVYWNNLTGGADQLAVGATYAFDPQNNFYWNVDYLRPIFTPDLRIGLGASRSAYDIGADLADLGIDGITEQAYIRLNYIFFQSFRDRLVGEVRFSRKDAETKQNGDQLSKDELAPLEIGIDYLNTDSLLAPEARANQLRLIANYTHGFPNLWGSMDGTDAEEASRIGADGKRAGTEYDKIVAGLIRKQAFFWDSDIWLRANGQFTDDFLVPLEQFAIGGPNSVRAYPVAEWLFDKGYFASLEWEFPVPFLKKVEDKYPNCMYAPKWASCGAPTKLSDAIRLSLFVDFAEGWLNNARSNKLDNQAVTGVGFGARYQTRNLRMGMSVATPVDSREASTGYDPQLFFNIAYQPF